MTADRETARLVRSWLQEDEHDSAERILVTVLDRLDTTPQRRSWWPARRSPMPTYAKLAVAAAAVLVVAVVGYNLLPGQTPRVGGNPTPSPIATEQPSPAASPTPQPTPRVLGSGDVTFPKSAGSFVIGSPFLQPLGLTFAEPWKLSRLSPGEASFNQVANGGPFIGFFVVDRVYKEPCHQERGTDAMPAAGGADQLVAALTSLPDFTVTTTPDRTIGGLPAKAFTLVNSIKASRCTEPPWLYLWDPVNGDVARATGNQVGESTELMWVVDLGKDRRPLLIVGETGQDATAGRAVLDAVIGSLTIN